MRHIWGLIVLILFIPAFGAKAQDVYLEIGQARLFFLATASETAIMRVSVPENSKLYFRLDYFTSARLDLRLTDLEGQVIPFSARQEGNSSFVEAEVSAAGDYLLRVTSENTYLRAEYALEALPAPILGENQTPFHEPMRLVFQEPFDDNERGWWTGQTETTTSKIVDGFFSMELEPNGQTFAGFSSLEAIEGSPHYLTAEVNIQGDTRDSSLGLLFRVVDNANYYLFQVEPLAGQWRFLVLDEGQWVKPFGWHPDARLKGAAGPHSIGVWVLDQTFFFVWDGQILGHVQDDTHLLGGIGLFAETAPEGQGKPRFVWDNVRLGIPDAPWARPFMAVAGTLSESESASFNLTIAERVLQSDLVGTWHWNNETNTQSMDWIFAEDGTYQQSIWAADLGTPQEQSGRWYIVNEVTLILEAEGLPDQRYNPRLDSQNILLTVPELNNRVFLRLES